ncbi:hypothetical protein PAXRUDRAFT_13317 [Paxillus rubicundulus Ve08.2h10]|uniref:Uncharacterized protein n=1 Tax=Paxillus rubicundulus Ve08.2h10 TaxID=930991 RepID=A0A0D0DLP7_9AGAM|nr:hypothetical protein PAXRUDRAFT_13317 [Paxillus rubicundulus Ve08.2h10]
MSDTEALQVISDVLNMTDLCEPTVLYSCHPEVIDWYYAVYSRRLEPGTCACTGTYNFILENILGHGSIITPAVIVMAGPQFDPAAAKWDVDPDEVARTLWWYH